MPGGIGAIITIIIIVAWVIRGIAMVMGKGDQGGRGDEQRQGRTPEEWEQVRRQRMAEREARMRNREAAERGYEESVAEAGTPHQPTPQELGQMTMAQRIELARQRARQQSAGWDGDAAEGLRRAREQAEGQSRQAQEQAEQEALRLREQQSRQAAEQRERERARRQAQRREAEAKAEQQRRAARRSRSRSQSGARQAKRSAMTGPVPVVTDKQKLAAESFQRVHHGQELQVSKQPNGSGGVTHKSLGTLNAASLRMAFVMKELLDKPLALRTSQDDLLS